jgi:hypothetical protein
MKIFFASHFVATAAVVALPSLLLAPRGAWAEGSTRDGDANFGGGNNGVNRVIRTGPGYTGVQAAVDELSFSMPTNEAGRYEVVDAQGRTVLNTNNASTTDDENGSLDLEVQPLPVGLDAQGNQRTPKGNKPSAYVGGEFHPAVRINDRNGNPSLTEIDVGLQYEPVTLYGSPPGWSVFFYLHTVGYINAAGNPTTEQRRILNPRVWDSTAARPQEGAAYRATGNSINGTMTMEAREAGSVGFTYSNFGNAIYANLLRAQLPVNERPRWDVDQANHRAAPWGDNTQPPLVVLNPALYNEGNVKRVTAMTRDSPYSSEIDGSRVVTRWSGGQVRPHNGALRVWGSQAGDVNQAVTGYDAPRVDDPRNNRHAYDKRFEGRRTIHPQSPTNSQTIVQFSNDPQVNEQMRSPQGTQAARYAAEDVTINQGTLARLSGEAVR